MKASELIEELKELIYTSGDFQVEAWSHEEFWPVDNVKLYQPDNGESVTIRLQ